MKIAILTLILSSLAQAAACNLANSYQDRCFRPRTEPKLKVLAVQFGGNYSEQVVRANAEQIARNFAAISSLKVEVLGPVLLPLDVTDRQLAFFKQRMKHKNFVKNSSKQRLQRLWYYYEDLNGYTLSKRIYRLLKRSPQRSLLSSADLVLVFSAAQYDGLGFNDGKFVFIENPVEIAWEASDGGRTQVDMGASQVNTMLHEFGHALGLGHASGKCNSLLMGSPEAQACCAASPARDDLMSYCRNRNGEQKFESCNLEKIHGRISRTLLKGGFLNLESDAQACK